MRVSVTSPLCREIMTICPFVRPNRPVVSQPWLIAARALRIAVGKQGSHMTSTRSHGFTLIELLITVVIAAILLAIAVPSYQAYVKRANRAAAESEMMNIANVEQQYFLDQKQYGDLSTLGYTLPSSVTKFYACAAAPGTAAVPSFTITCTPSGMQSDDGTLILDNTGNKTRSGSASLW
jgi:type IV pilus assembly protein PilE